MIEESLLLAGTGVAFVFVWIIACVAAIAPFFLIFIVAMKLIQKWRP